MHLYMPGAANNECELTKEKLIRMLLLHKILKSGLDI